MPPRRVTLTKSQLSTEDVTALHALLMEITKDGELSLGEIDTLKSWLTQRADRCEVPAIHYLLEAVNSVLLDGRVTPDDRLEILLAIERVLPLPDRKEAKAARLNAQEKTSVAQSPPEEKTESIVDEEPATEAQIAYIRGLGGAVPANLGKSQASSLIDELKSQPRAVSQRQLMVLRFWNKLELAHQGRVAVSDWMDEWYSRDRRHLEAWELFKKESGDDGGQGDPSRVAIGAGYAYLEKLGRRNSSNPFARAGDPPTEGASVLKWLLIVVIATLLVALVYYLKPLL